MTLHEMKLGEEICLYPYWVIRVPGGWIFKRGSVGTPSLVFVPYSTEFKQYNTLDGRPEPTTRPSNGEKRSGF